MVFAEVVRAVKAVVVVVSTGSDLQRIGDLSYKVTPLGPTLYIYEPLALPSYAYIVINAVGGGGGVAHCGPRYGGNAATRA